MSEGKPGNGAESPFGNGKGATMSGPSTGANNFLENPEGNGSSGEGRDFTKESRMQPTGSPPDIDTSSIPAGGKMPFGTGDSWARGDADGGVQPPKMPFKNLR
jgi:hypothetical protein